MKGDRQVTQSQLMLEEAWSMGCCVVCSSQQELLLTHSLIFFVQYEYTAAVAHVTFAGIMAHA